MRRDLSTDPSGLVMGFCPRCFAWTALRTSPGEVSLPQYEPMDMRWERASGKGLSPDVAHGYGYFGATLCGVGRGVSASPFPWVPTWDNACRACRDAAAMIDERWPLDAQGRKLRSQDDSLPPGPDWPPF